MPEIVNLTSGDEDDDQLILIVPIVNILFYQLDKML